MSKSKHNGVAPEDMIARWGADATRLFTLFKVRPGTPPTDAVPAQTWAFSASAEQQRQRSTARQHCTQIAPHNPTRMGPI
jgi:leucyl-tRNA synthetase